MNRIEVKILNPGVVSEAEKMMVCAARLTQSGHKIQSAEDFMGLYNKPYSEATVASMVTLPHPTIQKLAAINLVVVGASRRFLAQITRHQNEVKFMSASLQYSDYTGVAGFTVPYNVIEEGLTDEYLENCEAQMMEYDRMAERVGNDAAGYLAPQGLRNVLIISATPYQLKHMISQRVCRRNTDETRLVMLMIWDELMKLSPGLFKDAGPFCMNGPCKEGKMTCGIPIGREMTPAEIIADYFPLLNKETRI